MAGGTAAQTAPQFNDSHFHLTNYIQEGIDVRRYLEIMGDRVPRSTLFGIPLQQQWSFGNSGDFAYVSHTTGNTTNAYVKGVGPVRWIDKAKAKGIEGELWMVHSGGFYEVQNTLVAPKEMPKKLTIFIISAPVWPKCPTRRPFS